MKWRNSKERELLSSGGCREQTLPTKTNPHPDLSDVGKKSSAEEDDKEHSVTGESLGASDLRRSPTAGLELVNRAGSRAGSHISSPSLSCKLSDYSDSDEEEITVS